MANTSDVVTTTPWSTSAFYSTDSGAALSDVTGTWLCNATLYNDVLNSTNEFASDSPLKKKKSSLAAGSEGPDQLVSLQPGPGRYQFPSLHVLGEILHFPGPLRQRLGGLLAPKAP